MSDYMRKIIYLRRTENGTPLSTDGFARIEKKNGFLRVHLSLEREDFGQSRPFYAVYEKNGEYYSFLLGTTGEGRMWETRIPLARIETGVSAEEICGVLVGRPPDYLAGVCPGYGGRIAFEGVRFEKEIPEEIAPGAGMPTDAEAPAEKVSPDRVEPLAGAEKPAGAGEVDDVKIPAGAEMPTDAAMPADTERQADAEKQSAAEAAPGQKPDGVRDSFLEKLSEMYPFEDDEMEWCLQLEPKDFSSFPMEFWHLARNSFLLNGFYDYRHLLYARGGGKNYVGVPGQYHRREQYLAGRFGFPRFKGARKKRVTMGDFGYWLREL